jgi:hypothetical protein
MRQKVPSHSRESSNMVTNFIADSICYFLPMSLNSKADKIVTRHRLGSASVLENLRYTTRPLLAHPDAA